MNIPKLDKRTKLDIENRIRELNLSYTPEWKFSPENPDMATVAAELYADMLMEAIEKYNRTPEKNMVEFFSSLGTEPLYAKPAEGHVVFNISGNEENVKGVQVDKNSVLTAVGDNGVTNVYTTDSDLYVINSSLKDIISGDTENDAIYLTFSDDEEIGENLQRHIFAFSGEECIGINEKADILLEICPDSKDAGSIGRLLDEIEKCGIYYNTMDGYTKCKITRYEGNRFKLSFAEGLNPEKSEIYGIENYWFIIPFSDISGLDNIYIKDIRIGSRVKSLPVNSICNEMGELNSGHFEPYDTNPIPYTSIYFVDDSVLSRKGARVSLEFKINYELVPANSEENTQDIEWKNIMKKNKFKKQKEYDVSIKQVTWEYFNGSGWVRLFEENLYQEVFNGENDSQSVRLEFTCPENIESVFLPTGENYAIRARIAAIENYMKLASNYVVPVVSNPVFSYEYGQLPQSKVLITENNLEEKVYKLKECRHSIRPLYREKKEGYNIYFSFTAPLDMPHINLLFVMDKSEYFENSGYVWEYYGKDGWQSLYCRDETMGLTRTGILSLDTYHEFKKLEKYRREAYWIRLRYPEKKSMPIGTISRIYLNASRVRNLEHKPAEYFSVSDDDGYECRLGFGNVFEACVMVNEIQGVSGVTATEMIQEKKAEPVYGDNGELIELWVPWREGLRSEDGRTYYLNRDNSTVLFGIGKGKIPPRADSENVKITYVTCNGENGNLPAGRSFSMEKKGGYFAEIINPIDICGGSNKEIIGSTLERASGNLRMNGRLCTEGDYELAAKFFDRNIIKVRCMGNKDSEGKKSYGAMTLIVLLKNREYFAEISQKLKEYILKINCGNINPEKFQITEPDFVYYNIKLDIRVGFRESYSEKKKYINSKMKKYFDLASGGEKNTGWDIGQIPEKMAIYNILSDFEDVNEIQYFNITVFDKNGNELTEGELAEKKELERMIPILGGTDILINGN